MKTFKIYNTPYELEPTSSKVPDAYGFRNMLVDDRPKGKLVGYVEMEDGSTIECYKKFNPLLVVIPIAVLLLIAVVILVYLIFLQPKDVKLGSGNLFVKQGADNEVISYNGFMQLTEDAVHIGFQNGDLPATVSVYGEGIAVNPVSVEPNEYVAQIPATFTTDQGVVQAKIKITTETSEAEYDVVVEIPDNDTDNSTESPLEGYWKGEQVFGPNVESTE